MRHFVFILIAIFSVISLHAQENKSGLRDGDLLFCVAQSSNMSDAIVDATQTDEAQQYDHVAIYLSIDSVPTVIEAHPKLGVAARPLWQFLEENYDFNRQNGVIVMRVTTPVDIEAAMQRARQMVGQAYDWSFRPDNGKLYCSELVYESYLDNEGNHIFQAAPMNFRNAQGEFPDFWTELFKRNGETIPQDVPGTNPNAMIAEPILKAVPYSF